MSIIIYCIYYACLKLIRENLVYHHLETNGVFIYVCFHNWIVAIVFNEKVGPVFSPSSRRFFLLFIVCKCWL